MVSEMARGDLGVGGIVPLDLGKAGNCVAEVRQIEGARDVVVRKAADRLALRRPLDYGECGIRELTDVRLAPRGRRRVGSGDDQERQHRKKELYAHLVTPGVHAPHDIGRTIDGLAPL